MLSFLYKIIHKLTGPSVPKLYPGVPKSELYTFMDQREYQRIKRLPLVSIFPFFDDDDVDEQKFYGLGLAHLMIREAMELPDLSILGPEDAGLASRSLVHEHEEIRRNRQLVVTAAIHSPFAGEFEFIQNQDVTRVEIAAQSLQELVGEFLKALTTVLKIPGPSFLNARRRHYPKAPEQLIEYGQLWILKRIKAASNNEIEAAVWQLRQRSPSFVLPLWILEPEGNYESLIVGFQQDPNDAQLCFHIFLSLWKSLFEQPEAVQFLRKAIESSPGHGKSHMCFPHAADSKTYDLLNHSELGNCLLSGNSFALHNYINNLSERPNTAQRRLELAVRSIDLDSHDPFGYELAVDALVELGNDPDALFYAKRWRAVLDTMSERTIYCIEQNPQRKKLFHAGLYDPLAEVEEVIDQISRRVP